MDIEKIKPVNIDAYLSGFPENQQAVMSKIRHTIHLAVPGLTEAIKWSMPSFLNEKKKIVIQFAGAKKHVSIFPGVETVEYFKEKLNGVYDYSKGTVRIPYDKPVDYKLISEIAKYRSTLSTRFSV